MEISALITLIVGGTILWGGLIVSILIAFRASRQ